MHRPSLPRAFPWAPLGLATACVATMWIACGGNAVVDGASGYGGAGASSSSSSSSSANNSSSTGSTSCNCQLACSYLEPCGYFGPECLTICENGAEPEFVSCVCGTQGNCGAISGCGIGSTGTSVSVSSGVGGGGPLTPSCGNCFQNQFDNGFCVPEADVCVSDPQCQALVDCEANCAFLPNCVQGCENMYPGGVPESQALLSCLACGDCYLTCMGTYIVNYYCGG